MKVQPLGKRVMILRKKQETETKSGIILAEKSAILQNEGVITGIGKEVTSVKVGDKVLMENYSGTPMKIAGEEQVLIEEEHLIAILE